MCQVIVRKDVDEGYGFNEKILDWAIVAERTKKDEPIYPSIVQLGKGRFRLVLDHRGEKVVVLGQHFRKTFTTFDPEMEDRKTFGENHMCWNDPNSEFEIRGMKKPSTEVTR